MRIPILQVSLPSYDQIKETIKFNCMMLSTNMAIGACVGITYKVCNLLDKGLLSSEVDLFKNPIYYFTLGGLICGLSNPVTRYTYKAISPFLKLNKELDSKKDFAAYIATSIATHLFFAGFTACIPGIAPDTKDKFQLIFSTLTLAVLARSRPITGKNETD